MKHRMSRAIDAVELKISIAYSNILEDGKSLDQIIDEQPTIEPQQMWIPCSERLPEEYGEYRITWTTSASNKRFVGDSEYEVTSEWDDEHYRFKGEWLLDDYIKNYPDVKVIAWKPLEEPYREGAVHITIYGPKTGGFEGVDEDET